MEDSKVLQYRWLYVFLSFLSSLYDIILLMDSAPSLCKTLDYTLSRQKN